MAARCVACAGEATQPQPLEAMMRFQVREAHLHAFPLVSRLYEGGRSHQPACHVAGILVEVARDLTRRLLWAAPHLQRADVAVTL